MSECWRDRHAQDQRPMGERQPEWRPEVTGSPTTEFLDRAASNIANIASREDHGTIRFSPGAAFWHAVMNILTDAARDGETAPAAVLSLAEVIIGDERPALAAPTEATDDAD